MPSGTARLLMTATLGALLLLPSVPAAAQEGKVVGYVMDSRGEIRPVRKLAKSEVPFFDLVETFYWSILNDYRYGDAALNQTWKMLGVKPDSPEANFILKAAFRAQALELDITIPPLGDSEEEFLKAQYRNQQREVTELQQVTLTMLRELGSSNVPLDLWAVHLEEKIRPMIGVTIYGDGTGEYTRKYNRLLREFEAAIKAELESAGNGAP